VKVFAKSVKACSWFLAAVAACILLVLLLAVCFATFSRYLFNRPFAPLIDLSSYALVWVAFLGAPWLMGQRRHIRIDLIADRVSPRARQRWGIVIDYVVVGITWVIAIVGGLLTVDYLIKGRVIQDVLATPRWILLLPIPVGSFFWGLQSLLNGIEDFKKLKEAGAASPESRLRCCGDQPRHLSPGQHLPLSHLEPSRGRIRSPKLREPHPFHP